MKKVLLSLILIIILINGSYAQPWAKPGATWYYNFGNIWTTSGYYRITNTGTTIINGKTVNVLNTLTTAKNWNGTINSGSSGNIFTYADSNIVFFARDCDSIFHELFNFNKLAGDSFIVDSMTCYLNCGSSKTYVDSTSTEIINSTSIRVQYLSQPSFPYPQQSFGGKINFYFGGLDYFLPQGNCITDGDYVSGLRCYYDSSGYFFSTLQPNLSCDYILQTTEINTSDDISLYPNPAHKEIIVNIENKNYSTLLIYNILGEKVYKNNQVKGSIKIDMSNFETGIYFVNINDGVATKTKKFIVEE